MPQYELNLRDYLRIFRKKRLMIIIPCLAGMVFSAAHFSKQKVFYQSSTTVKIDERKSVTSMLTEVFVYNPGDYLESQLSLITGFPVMKGVALRLGMINDKSSIQEIYLAVNQLQSQISNSIVGRTNIIKITATADDPKAAVRLANAVAEVFIEESLLEKTKQARTGRVFIEEQLEALKKRFAATEDQLKEIEHNVKGIKLAIPIQEKLVDLEFELATILQKYTEKHPQVEQLKEQIKHLERQLAGFSGEELEYARLLREVEVNKKLYGLLSEKLEESRISEAQKISDVSVVDPAVIAICPVAPQKKIGVLAGGLMGLVLGFVLAFIAETMDTSIGTVEDVENVVKLFVLGVVPSIISEFERGRGILIKLKRRIFPVHKSEGEESYIKLFVHYQPKASVTEAFRNIRTNLKLGPSKKTILITSAGPGEGKTTTLINLGLVIAQTGAKTLLVSSDLRRPAVEKTFGVKRKPGLNEIISGTVGLGDALRNISDIMLGFMQVDEILKAPGIENIWILPSGQIPLNPSEILESKSINNIIEELRKKFDVILFDSPPILPLTDASLLASKMDGVVLVYEIGRMSRSALLRAKIQLESVGAKISGIILNHIHHQTEANMPYPYYYRYKYRYRYYTQDKPAKKGKAQNLDDDGGSV